MTARKPWWKLTRTPQRALWLTISNGAASLCFLTGFLTHAAGLFFLVSFLILFACSLLFLTSYVRQIRDPGPHPWDQV